jgi:DNA-binding NarL/FixJ family response regulator
VVTAATRTRVLLAEDHMVVAEALATMLAFEDDIEVVAVVTSGAEAVRVAAETAPDVVLVDVRLDGLNGIEATRRIRAANPDVQAIALTMHDDAETVAAAVAAGALGFLPKNTSKDELLLALRKVRGGEAYLHPSVTAPFLRRVAPLADRSLAHARLTAREHEVLEHLADGKTTREIADALVLGEETVKTHLAHIYQKLGVGDRVEAVAVALRRGLVD